MGGSTHAVVRLTSISSNFLFKVTSDLFLRVVDTLLAVTAIISK